MIGRPLYCRALVVLTALTPSLGLGAAEEEATLYRAAFVEMKQGQFTEAERDVNAALAIDPKSLTIVILKAKILAANGKFKESETLLAPLLATKSPNPAVLLAQAEILLRNRRFTESEQILNHLLPLADSESAKRIRLKLIYCAVEQNEWLTSTRLLSALHSSDARYPGYYLAQAAISFAQGDPIKADGYLQTARTIYGIHSLDEELDLYVKLFVKQASPSPAPYPTPTLAPK